MTMTFWNFSNPKKGAQSNICEKLCFCGTNAASFMGIVGAVIGTTFCGSSTAVSIGSSSFHHALAENPVRSSVKQAA